MTPHSWIFPNSVEEAVRSLSEPSTIAVAAGTTVLDLMKMGHHPECAFVDLTGLPLRYLEDDNEALRIGALVSNADVAAAPAVRSTFRALSEAIDSGASQQIRNAATVGGNILQATRCSYFRSPAWACNRRVPGSGCEALEAPMENHALLGGNSSCIAVHPSDMAVALVALDARLTLAGPQGSREIFLRDFYRLPGEAPHITNDLGRGEIITDVIVPKPNRKTRSTYVKLRGRASYEFASASAAVALTFEEGRPVDVAVALGGIGTVPWRHRLAERRLAADGFDPANIEAYCDRVLAEADGRAETIHKADLTRGAVLRAFQRLLGQ